MSRISPLAGALCALLLTTGAPVPAAAQNQRLADLPAGQAYGACMALVEKNPADGFEAAIAWRDEGGGPAAQHCSAMALVNLGQFADAASRLEGLADSMKDYSAAERAAVLGQSGRAWHRAGQSERAVAVLTIAINLVPGDAELRIDRGEVLATTGKFWEAIDDFNIALELAPQNIDALIFRGAAYRLLDTPELARVDLETVLARKPDQPDALVEMGAVALQEGKRDAARQYWLHAIRVAPKAASADAARRWLERLDVKTK